MSYNDDLKAAQVAKSGEKLTIEYREFKEKGDIIIGRFLATVEITSRTNQGKYNQYIFDTDAGKIKFHCGAFFDKDAGSLMSLGNVYAITFQGKKKLEGGNTVNLFDLLLVPSRGGR